MTEPAFKIVGSMEIAKLSLRRGDVLVIKTDRPTSQQIAERIRAHVKPLLPVECSVLVIDPGIEISVLTKADIKGRAA